MTEVAFNAPQYGYGGGASHPPAPQPMPQPMPQPPMPQPLPVDDDDPDDHTSMGSYDVDPAPPSGESAQPTSGPPAVSSGRVAVQVVDRLRNTAERGTTTVPNEVIEKIATLAVREVPGVYEFAAGTGGDARPLTIVLHGRTASVEIHVVVEYGFAVYAVTEKVRTKVISALENLFALEVTGVDIVIDDIHIADPAAED